VKFELASQTLLSVAASMASSPVVGFDVFHEGVFKCRKIGLFIGN
jgi:hypothetical protein